MKQTIYLNDFRNAFIRANRADNFSYEGLEALFNYIEEVDPDFDLDVIALCCEYTEYESLEAFNKEHDHVDSLDEIRDRTTVIEVDSIINGDSFIIANY